MVCLLTKGPLNSGFLSGQLAPQVALLCVRGLLVHGTIATSCRSASSHTTTVQNRRTARSTPGTEVVEVVVGATLGSRVDCPLGRVANCRLEAKTACVHLVSKLGLVWNRTPGLAVTLGTSNRAAIGEPKARLSIGSSQFTSIGHRAPSINPGKRTRHGSRPRRKLAVHSVPGRRVYNCSVSRNEQRQPRKKEQAEFHFPTRHHLRTELSSN